MSQDTFITRKDTLRGRDRDRSRKREGLSLVLESTAKVHVFRTCTGYDALVLDTRRELAFRGETVKNRRKGSCALPSSLQSRFCRLTPLT